MDKQMSKAQPHIMIVEARFYDDVSDMLLDGTKAALEKAGMGYEIFEVPGALEIPTAIAMGRETGKFDGYIALGCVIRGETSHYDVVANESARGLTDLSLKHGLVIGNGILTCDTKEQAIVRADPAQKDKGGFAVKALTSLLDIQKRLELSGHD